MSPEPLEVRPGEVRRDVMSSQDLMQAGMRKGVEEKKGGLASMSYPLPEVRGHCQRVRARVSEDLGTDSDWLTE